MSATKLRVVLQGTAKYRDGKKWKKRYCLLSLSSKNQDALHFYMAKSYDDFAPYRNESCLVDFQLPLADRSLDYPNYSRPVLCPMDSNRRCSVDPISPSDSSGATHHESAVVVNTAAQSCVAYANATVNSLSAAASLATRLNAPGPVDEIVGYESGYHMDKESNIVVLLGSNAVYILALPGTDEMFRWAEALSQVVTDNRFRVTLRRSAEGSKLPQGLQGSLHVQRWRLCLIGEPSVGCKFICSWRLDSILQAYTLSSPGTADSSQQSVTSSGTAFGRRSLGERDTGSAHRVLFGNVSVTGPNTWSQQLASQTKPKSLFILEAAPSCGKGRGTHTFELDGSLLNQLVTAIGEFMNRRYLPLHLIHAQSASTPHDPRPLDQPGTSVCSLSNHTPVAYSKLSGPQPIRSFAAAATTTATSDSISNAIPSGDRAHSGQPPLTIGTFASRSSPLPVPFSLHRPPAPSYSDRRADPNLGVLPVSMQAPSSRVAQGVDRLYSNIIPPTACSLSAPDHVSTSANRSTGDTDRCAAGAACAASSTDSWHSGYIGCGHRPATAAAAAENTKSLDLDSDPALIYHTCSRRSADRASDTGSTYRRPALPVAGDELQVARVPAGLVISKWGTGTSTAANKSNPTLPRPPSHNCSRHTLADPLSAANGFPQDAGGEPKPSPHYPPQPPLPYRMCRRCLQRWSVQMCRLHRFAPDTLVADQQPQSNTIVGGHQAISNGLKCQHNILHSPGGVDQHGVFQADEDISDSEPLLNRRTSESDGTEQHRVLFTKPHSNRPRSVDAAPTPGEWDIRALADYRIYRRRLRQYRGRCDCFTYAGGRSLSADLLSRLCVLQWPTMRPYEDMDQSEPRQFGAPAAATTTAAASDYHNNSPAGSSVLKLALGSTRLRNIHRLFHRKHSKSHDSLHQHSYQPSGNRVTGPWAVGHPVLLASSSSVTDGPRDSSCNAERTPGLPPPGRSDLLVHCTRHGLRPYSVWLHGLRNPGLDVTVCVRCRHRLHTSSHPTASPSFKSKPSCMCLVPATTTTAATTNTNTTGVVGCGGTAMSVVSALRSLVHGRHKSRGAFSFGKVCVRRRISAPSKDVPRASSISVDPAGLVRASRGTSFSKQANPAVSLDPTGYPLIPLTSSHHHRTRSQCSFDMDQPRCQSALSLTSVPCSEPTLSTVDWIRVRLPLISCCSWYSASLASLPTSYSISDSSSLISAYHGVMTWRPSYKKKKRIRPKPELDTAPEFAQHDVVVVGTRSSSFGGETDEMSSGSGPHCDECFAHERHSGSRLGGGYSDLTKNLYVDCSPFKTPPPPPLHPAPPWTCDTCGGASGSHESSERRIGGAGGGGPPRDLDPPILPQTESNAKRRSSIPPLSWSKLSWSATTPDPFPGGGSQLSRTAVDRWACECVPVRNQRAAPFHSDCAQRSNTLPATTRTVSGSDRDDNDDGDDGLGRETAGVSSQQPRENISSNSSSKSSITRFSHRIKRTARYHKTVTGSLLSSSSSSSSNAVPAERYDLPAGAHSPDRESRVPHQAAYCNIEALQQRADVAKAAAAAASVNDCLPDCMASDRHFPTTQSLYVNLPASSDYPQAKSVPSRSHMLLQAVHPSTGSHATRVVAVQSLSSSSLVGVLESASVEYATRSSTIAPFNMSNTQALCACGAPVCASSGVPPPTLTELPVEVRDPSRNYAMVDLRPSPANSANLNNDLSRGATILHNHPPRSGQSSAASMLGFSTSTSTGSDCASDAATLTSDTMGSYVCAGNTEQGNNLATTAAGTSATTTTSSSGAGVAPQEPTRRRHSHSMSAAVSDTPGLNYVHVMVASSTAHPTTLHGGDNAGPTMTTRSAHRNSPSSSSGLGGVASQSLTPPLPGTSGVDMLTSRSMTSSVTSSGEGVTADRGFHSTSPIDDESVPYTQIDFTRTLALGEVRGDLDHHCQQPDSTGPISFHTRSSWRPGKPTRSTSMRKTFTQPIRSIRRGTKKGGGGTNKTSN